jgi:hypothetical protein
MPDEPQGVDVYKDTELFCCIYLCFYMAACYLFLKLAILCLRCRCAVFTFPVECFLMVIMGIRHLNFIPIATPPS